MGSTLFELTGEFLTLQQTLADFDGDISEADKEAEIDKLFADLAENQDQLEDKLDGYVAVMSEFEARFEYRKKEAKRLQILANRDEAEFERLKERLKAFFKLIGKTEFQSKLHKFKLNKTGGKQALDLKRELTQTSFLSFTNCSTALSLDLNQSKLFQQELF